MGGIIAFSILGPGRQSKEKGRGDASFLGSEAGSGLVRGDGGLHVCEGLDEHVETTQLKSRPGFFGEVEEL